MAKTFQVIENITKSIDKRIFQIVSTLLLVLMALNVVNITSRYLFNKPIEWTVEVSVLILVSLVFLTWGYTTGSGGHVALEIMAAKFPSRTRSLVKSFISLLILGTFIMMLWAGIEAGLWSHKMGATTDLLRIPIYPFRFLIPVGSLFVVLEVIIQFRHTFRTGDSKE